MLVIHLSNKFNIWNVHRTMNTSVSRKVREAFFEGLHVKLCISDSMNIPKFECIAYVYI